MPPILSKDHHSAYLRPDGVLIVANAQHIVGEFSSQTGQVCGLFQPVSRWEQDTAKSVALEAVNCLAKG